MRAWSAVLHLDTISFSETTDPGPASTEFSALFYYTAFLLLAHFCNYFGQHLCAT